MKTNTMFVFPIAALLLTACGKDDKTPALPNRPPGEFSLITVINEESRVELTPEFSWNQAVDPDGDKVTYTLYMGINNSNPATVYASGLEATSYMPEEPLHLQRRYYWRVEADDGKGGKVSSPVFEFQTRKSNPAKRMTASAAFAKRFQASALAYKGKLWLIGGRGVQGIHYNDVWSSPDGENWERRNAAAPFERRAGHTTLVFKDKMWVIGGRDGQDYLGDVWYSDDGANWRKTSGKLPPRYGHRSLVYDGKMWVTGGYNGTKCLSDVWYSEDGANWTRATDKAAFPPRAFHSALAYKGKMYVLCGWQASGNKKLDDIWVSTDGKTWELSTIFETTVFPLSFHTSLVYGGNMFLIGGATPNDALGTRYTFRLWHDNNKPMMYASADGAYAPRRFPAATVFDGKVWVIAGSLTGLLYNDVWYFD